MGWLTVKSKDHPYWICLSFPWDSYVSDGTLGVVLGCLAAELCNGSYSIPWEMSYDASSDEHYLLCKFEREQDLITFCMREKLTPNFQVQAYVRLHFKSKAEIQKYRIWCQKNSGKRWKLGHNYRDVAGYYCVPMLAFSNVSDAMAFKLVWGNEVEVETVG